MLDWIDDLFDSPQPTFAPIETSILPRGLRRTLEQLLMDCKSMYRSAAQKVEYGEPEAIQGDPSNYADLLEDLARGVIIKGLVEIANCDRRWNQAEREVAIIVLRHAWGAEIDDDALTRALKKVVAHSEKLKWSDLLAPFAQVGILQREREELRANLLRLINVIAKSDGRVLPAEQEQLRATGREIEEALFPERVQKSNSRKQPKSNLQVAEVIEPVDSDSGSKSASQTRVSNPAEKASSDSEAPSEEDKAKLFDEAQEELESLIGLESIKSDVKQLIDFLKVQTMRREHNLPAAEISFHAVFEGNPGTGKTTVARIVSRLLCGLGILDKGQTVETDRTGLVAQFAGQTGPRTNERVDEALGGVLFVDEAYSLVSENAEDAYGTEAVQTLLKRMEDDRDKFVVVLAGYPAPMQKMLRSNPGLSSRFQRTYRFADYSAKDLLRIYYVFCQKYHYRLPKPTRRKLLGGFDEQIKAKDEHFGNGRLARNVFEQSIRNMSSRVVNVAPLTREVLTTIQPEDVDFQTV